MTHPLLAMLNTPEIIALLVLALILFGAKKLPELARGLGHGIKEFRKATRDVTDELQSAMDVDPTHPPPRQPYSSTYPSGSSSESPPDSPPSEPSSESPPDSPSPESAPESPADVSPTEQPADLESKPATTPS